jgi:hypothetical protein
MESNNPTRTDEREDEETVRIVLERLRTAAGEPKRDDSALDEIIRKRKQQQVPH